MKHHGKTHFDKQYSQLDRKFDVYNRYREPEPILLFLQNTFLNVRNTEKNGKLFTLSTLIRFESALGGQKTSINKK